MEAIGTNVTRFRPGDAAFGACAGAFAEYIGRALVAPLRSRTGRGNVVSHMARIVADDLATLGQLVLSGKVVPVVGRTCTLDEVPDALRQSEAGHVRGKVVIIP